MGRVVEDVELSQRDFFRELQRAPEDDLQCSHRHHLCDTIQLCVIERKRDYVPSSWCRFRNAAAARSHGPSARPCRQRPYSDVDSRAARRRFVVIGVHDRIHVEHYVEGGRKRHSSHLYSSRCSDDSLPLRHTSTEASSAPSSPASCSTGRQKRLGRREACSRSRRPSPVRSSDGSNPRRPCEGSARPPQ